MINRSCLAFGLLAGLCAASASIQAAESPDKAAATQKTQAPKAGESKKVNKVEAELPPKTKMALKLAGLVTFVASSCPELEPDYTRFKGAVGALGLSTADLDRTEMKATYLAYTMRYKQDRSSNCARALKDFGPSGGVVADLIRPRAK